MASRLYRPVEKQVVVDISSLPIGASTTVFLARQIDVLPFSTVTALVRCHTGTLIGAALATANFIVNADGFTSEDPSATDGGALYPAFQQPLVTNSLLTSFAVGQMRVIPVPTPTSLLSLSLAITQGASAGAVRYVLSVDLVCKEF